MNSYGIPWKLRDTWQGKAANDPLVMVHFDKKGQNWGTNPLVGSPGWKCSREMRPFVQVESVGLCWHRLDTSWCIDFSSFFYHVLRPKNVKVRCEYMIEKIYIKYQLYISYISAIYQLYIAIVYHMPSATQTWLAGKFSIYFDDFSTYKPPFWSVTFQPCLILVDSIPLKNT
jgi:hypothetical protein